MHTIGDQLNAGFECCYDKKFVTSLSVAKNSTILTSKGF